MNKNMKIIYKIPAKDINLFYGATRYRTIIAPPNDIEKAFYTYEEAENFIKASIPEDGAAIYVTYEDKFLLVYGIDEKTGDILISDEYLMDNCIIGVRKMQHLAREMYYGKDT